MQRPSHDFDAIYASETPPAWDIGRPQPAFDRLAKAGDLVGSVLDPGCGTGEHALLAAALDHGVVGVDLSAKAIELAMSKAIQRGVKARFLVADALRLADLGEQFDTVLDCGLFHVLDDDERGRYVGSLAAVVPPGGRYHMLCFSDLQPGEWGPRRVAQDEIRAAFSAGWEVEFIEPTIIRPHLGSRRRPRLAGGGQTHVGAGATLGRMRHTVLSWESVGNSEWAKWRTCKRSRRPG